MPEVIVFQAEDLLPDAWRHFSASGPVRAFNPGLLLDDRGWIFAYRIVGPDGLRRIGLCRLDENFRVIAGSASPLSDQVRFANGRDYSPQATTWFADPRLYRLRGRVFVYWNSGWHEPQNHQFLQELDPARLEPIGPPREMMLRGPRQPLEKNWTLFERGGLHAVYSATPHRLLTFSLAGDGEIMFEDFATSEWNNEAYAVAHGALRGGAPPERHDGHYWSFCHSVAGEDGDYRYTAAVYRFAAEAPFAPTDAPTGALLLLKSGGFARRFPKLNPAVGEVTYPCGAIHDAGRWIVSFGINDEQCAIALLSHEEVAAVVRPLKSPGDWALQAGGTRR
jgi:hypothetical protein